MSKTQKCNFFLKQLLYVQKSKMLVEMNVTRYVLAILPISKILSRCLFPMKIKEEEEEEEESYHVVCFP